MVAFTQTNPAKCWLLAMLKAFETRTHRHKLSAISSEKRKIWPLKIDLIDSPDCERLRPSPACTVRFNSETFFLEKLVGHHASVEIGRADDGEPPRRLGSHRRPLLCCARLTLPNSHHIPPSRWWAFRYPPTSRSCALATSFSYPRL